MPGWWLFMRNPGMPANIIKLIHLLYKGIPGYGGNYLFQRDAAATRITNH